MPKDGDPIVVYSGGAIDCSLLKSMLDAMDVPAHLQDQAVGRLGYVGMAVGGVKIVVARRDVKAAQEIVDRFIENRA